MHCGEARAFSVKLSASNFWLSHLWKVPRETDKENQNLKGAMAIAQSDSMDVEQCSVDETQLDVPRDDSKEELDGTDLLDVISEHDHALNGSKLKFQIQRKKEAQSDTNAAYTIAYTLRVDTHVATITSFGASARRNELPIRFEVLEPKNQLIELASDESSTSFCGRFIFAGEAVSLLNLF